MVDEESNERDFALSLEMKDRLLFWRQFTHSEQVCLCLSFSLRISICLSFFLYCSLSISVYMSLSLSLSLRWPDIKMNFNQHDVTMSYQDACESGQEETGQKQLF